MRILYLAFALVWIQVDGDRAWAVGSKNLGATYDADETHLTFTVFSSRATRVEVWLYDQPATSAQKASFALTADPTTNFWSTTLAIPDLAAKGLRPLKTEKEIKDNCMQCHGATDKWEKIKASGHSKLDKTPFDEALKKTKHPLPKT